MRLSATLFAMLLSALFPTLAAAPPQLETEGITIANGPMGRFALSYPELQMRQGGKKLKGHPKIVSPQQAEITYDQPGIKTTVTIQGNQATIRIDGTAELSHYRMDMMIPFQFASGGVWACPADAPAQPFPKLPPPAPHLYQKHNTSFLFGDGAGRSITLKCRPSTFMQLQDNRKWNWKIFQLVWSDQLPGDGRPFTLTVDLVAVNPASVQPKVDRFGQPTALDFPNKVKTEAELKDDITADRAYYAALTPPERSRFGGLPGSREKFGLKGTGFFRVDKVDGRDVLITPDGDLFFQLGVCCINPCDDYTLIEGRREIYAWLPPADGEFKTAFRAQNANRDFSFYIANVIRKTGRPFDLNTWKGEMIDRLLRWGFNSQGAFADITQSQRERNFPYTPSLPLSEWSIKPLVGDFFDPFDNQVKQRIEELFLRHVRPAANDPLIIGYFLANEQRYSDLPRQLAAAPGNSAVRRQLVDFLRQRHGEITAFNRAWQTDYSDFAALSQGILPLKTEKAAQDMSLFTARFLDEYFKVINTAFRRYDANHLLLGSRFLPAMVNQENAVKACARYCDVFSINYYTYQIEKDFLSKAHQLSNRPLLLSEWSFGTAEQGLAGGVRDVGSQQERGLAYRNYVEQAAALPYVIGSQWFSFLDQALTGRYFQHYNGECMNIGMVNVADRPFKDFLAEAMKTNYRIYDVMLRRTPPFAWNNAVGQAAVKTPQRLQIPHALPGHRVDGERTPWPGRPSDRITAANLVTGKDAGKISADFWLCWDEKNLYLFMEVNDPTPCRNRFNSGHLWNGDCIELFIGGQELNRSGALLFSDRQLLLAAKPNGKVEWYNAPEQYPVRSIVLPRPDSSGYTLEAAIPWAALQITPKTGTTFRFDLGIDDNNDTPKRLRQLMWSGTERNSAAREKWGFATLVN